MLSSSEQSEPRSSDAEPELQQAPAHAPSAEEIVTLSQTLETLERTKLIVGLWKTLPTKNQAAFLAFGLQELQKPIERRSAVNMPFADAAPSPLWQLLFDPSKTSELYSAPRRFDLATIFVVTAAYSVLLGIMSAMDFGPVAKVVVGLLVTSVAAAQAFYHKVANPRGVSIVAGAISLSIILGTLGVLVKHSLEGPLPVIVIFYGMIGGAISGYLCGVLVGGVFLFADMLRTKLERRKANDSDEMPPEDVEAHD